MSTSTPLSQIVRRLTRKEEQQPRRRGEVRLIYDAKSGTILEKRPRLAWRREIHHYAVFINRPTRGRGPSVRLHAQGRPESIELEVHYEAWCEKESNVLVTAFHGEEAPSQLVDQLIEDEITSFSLKLRQKDQDLTVEFYALRQDLEQTVKKAAERELGLVLVPTIRPRLEGKIPRISVETGLFEARPLGANHALEFDCVSEIQVDLEDQTAALLGHREAEGIQDRFRDRLIEAIQTEVTLQELAQEMLFRETGNRSSEVEKRLMHNINQDLAKLGRRVSFLTLLAPSLRKPVPIQMEYEVRCPIQDREEQVTIRHRLRMQPMDLGKIVSSKLEDPKRWVEARLKQHSKAILFKKTYVDLHDGAGPAEIEERIRKDVLDAGYEIENIISKLKLKPLKVQMFQMEFEVSCPIKDSEQAVTVKHRLLVEPVDRSEIVRSRISDPKSWIERRLDRHTRTVLFKKTYLDLLLRFNPSEIKEEVSKEASRVGYSVQQMISIPDLEPLTWRDGLSVECGENEFATHDSRIRVGLDIVVSGRIEDLENSRLQPYLGPESSRIYGDIRKDAVRAAQRVMHEINPHSFYLGFRNAGVAEKLEKGIEETLVKRFALSELNVILKPLETELTKRIQYLSNGPHRVEVECPPLRSGGRREKVTLSIGFDILGVAEPCWHIFCSRIFGSPEEELEKIKEVLRSGVLSSLGTFLTDQLQYRSRQSQRLLAKSLAPVGGQIYRSFGLEIHIFDVYRYQTYGEIQNSRVLEHDIEEGAKQGRLVTTRIHEATESRLGSLLEKEEKMLLAGYEDDDSELVSLRQRVQDIKDEVLPYRTREERDHVPHLQDETEAFSPEDYQQELLPSISSGKLSDGEMPRQLKAGTSEEAGE